MTAKCLAILGGTIPIGDLEVIRKEEINTPFGACVSELRVVKLAGVEVVFLPRHGNENSIPPHKVNYRANIWALHSVGVSHIIGIAAVGGISRSCFPGKIMIPDQIIDYTFGRRQTFFEENLSQVTHIDFVQPYCSDLREVLLQAGVDLGFEVLNRGTYGVTQGPRLETAAEVMRMRNDGCDVVGMTAMPEAALAKELNLCYATCAFSVNWAAGVESSKNEIKMSEVQKTAGLGTISVRQLLEASVKRLGIQ